MRAASLRLGSQGVKKSYDDHLLIIGDAAGHIDPLTGETLNPVCWTAAPLCGLHDPNAAVAAAIL